MMKQLLTLLVLLLGLSLSALAQVNSNLPPCPLVDYSKNVHLGEGGRTGKWHNCFGRYVNELNDAWKGDVYEGEFKDGFYSGHGTHYYFANNVSKGVKYVGEFKYGKPNGQGTFTFADGSKYTGVFKDGRHGKRIVNGYEQEGIWTDGKFIDAEKINLPPCPAVDYSKNTHFERFAKWHNCYGRYVFELNDKWTDDTYVGEFRFGKFNGNGTYTNAGDIRTKYVGEFKDGKYHGQGILSLNGRILDEGIWENHVFVRAKKITFPPVNQQTDVAINEEPRKLDDDRQALNNSTNSDLFVIHPQFDWVGPFKEGVAPVRVGDFKNGKYGFINKQGKFVIQPQFDWVGDFNNGLASVRIGDVNTGKYGFINIQGKFVINPNYDLVNSFVEGLASVRIGDDKTGKYGFINMQGEFVINPQFGWVDNFQEDLALFHVDGKPGKYGYIDKEGKIVIKAQFTSAHSFSEGLAVVSFGIRESVKYGYIDKQGKIIIKAQFTSADSFSEGLASVRIGSEKTSKSGFIDKKGKIVINPQFTSAYQFSEGLALVSVSDGQSVKYAYIDKQGKMVINPQFDSAVSFREGLASVRIGDWQTGKWGFIDKQGKIVINPQFDNNSNYLQSFFLSNTFSDGLSAGCITDNLIRKCGFISNNAGQSSKLATVQKEQKQQDENKWQSSKLSLQTTTTNPDVNGNVTITVRTNADTSSLKVNGEEQGGRSDGNYVIKKVARVGQDTNYVITALDTNGNTDTTTITVARQAVPPSSNQSASLKPESIKRVPIRDAVAIIIGIQNYKRVPKAEFANNDAKEFYEYAIRGLGIKPENIKLLLDEEADDVNIVKAFENWLPLQVNKGKTDVYVFYSGHGLPSNDGKSLYFLPYGVDKELLTRTAVGQAEVVSALVASKPKSVTMFIDACYSGQTRGGETLLASAKPIALKADTNAFPSNFTVITASSNDQISSSSPELKHGIFSFYLMKGMEGDADGNKDGKITAGEMQEYLSDKVSRQAMSMSRKQDTQLVGDANRVLMGR